MFITKTKRFLQHLESGRKTFKKQRAPHVFKTLEKNSCVGLYPDSDRHITLGYKKSIKLRDE